RPVRRADTHALAATACSYAQRRPLQDADGNGVERLVTSRLGPLARLARFARGAGVTESRVRGDRREHERAAPLRHMPDLLPLPHEFGDLALDERGFVGGLAAL